MTAPALPYTPSQIAEAFSYLSPERARELDAHLAALMPPNVARVWRPHPGFQSRAWGLDVFEALIGGAAGPGKTDILLYRGLKQINNGRFRKLFLRRTFAELREVMDRALLTFPQFGGVWKASEKRWAFPSGASYEFGYCERYEDVLQYQGQEFTEIDIDEAGQLTDFTRIWTYLMSRCRRGGNGLVMSMWCSANPGGPAHVQLKRRFVEPCLADGTPIVGKAGLTRAFLAGKLADNPSTLANDPMYVAKLNELDETTRKQLLEGDWSAGEGMALAELSRDVHLVPAFAVPTHWTFFGAHDWGYNHPFAFGLFAADEDGNVYLVESCQGKGLLPRDIVDRVAGTIRRALSLEETADAFARLDYTHAGHDCWNQIKARGELTPTLAEQYYELGWDVSKANISRVTGLQNMRRYLAWRRPDNTTSVPRFRIMDTPDNRRVFETLEGMIADPDNIEDALKVDANGLGENGDDYYDMTRYGLASRPFAALPQPGPKPDGERQDPMASIPAGEWAVTNQTNGPMSGYGGF